MDHTLSLLESVPYPYPSGCFLCNLCQEEGCGPVYHCSDCNFDVHVACAATATQQTHFSHPRHPLHLAHCGTHHRKCNSCGSGIHTWSFRCELCDYDMHSMCVRAPRFIMHPCHPHPLALSKAADLPGPGRCDGCKMPVANLLYRCRTCQYNLHQVCATLPKKIKHVKHQAHMLTLMMDPLSQERCFFLCRKCGVQVKGWCFHCAICNFNLHPGCTNLVHELPHVGVNPPHERSNATTSTSASIGRTISHGPLASTWRNVTHTPLPSNTDWEAVERVLQYAQEMAKGFASYATQGIQDDNQYHCPTCLEGFDSTNPKKITSCGHYFHLACILEWMERSTECPICRKHLNISM